MKNNSLLTIIILFSMNTWGQVDSLTINKLNEIRSTKDYLAAIRYIEDIQTKTHDTLWCNYQLGCYYTLMQDTANAYNQIFLSINYGAKREDVLTDTDFEILHTYNTWQNIIDTLNQKYLDKYPGITHPELALELLDIYIEDQRYRTLMRNYKKRIPTGYEKKKGKADIVAVEIIGRKNRVVEIIETFGWPTYNMVGGQAAEAVFLVIQHSDLEYIKKYVPLIKQACLEGEASRMNFAKMYDRMLINKRKKQYYGTQMFNYGFEDENGICHDEPMQIYKIKDSECVNYRRQFMGLPPISEQAKTFGVPTENIPIQNCSEKKKNKYYFENSVKL